MIDIIYNNENNIVRIIGGFPEIEITQNGDLVVRNIQCIILAYSSGQWKRIERSVNDGQSVINIELTK